MTRLSAVEPKRAESGAPALELVEPVGQGALGDEDDVRAADPLVLVHVGQHADALQRLAEPHLVRQDAFVDSFFFTKNKNTPIS